MSRVRVVLLRSRDGDDRAELDLDIEGETPHEWVVETPVAEDLGLYVVERFRLINVRTHDHTGSELRRLTYLLSGTEFADEHDLNT